MCPTIIQQQTRLLKISWILLSCQRHRDSWLWNNSYRISTDWRSYGRGLTESYWCSNNWNGNIWYHDYSGGFQKKGKMGMVYSLVLSYFLDNTLVGELPPANDHIHQIVFIVISLLGLLLPVRQLFSRNMVKS
jgi:hypothetical protein